MTLWCIYLNFNWIHQQHKSFYYNFVKEKSDLVEKCAHSKQNSQVVKVRYQNQKMYLTMATWYFCLKITTVVDSTPRDLNVKEFFRKNKRNSVFSRVAIVRDPLRSVFYRLMNFQNLLNFRFAFRVLVSNGIHKSGLLE